MLSRGITSRLETSEPGSKNRELVSTNETEGGWDQSQIPVLTLRRRGKNEVREGLKRVIALLCFSTIEVRKRKKKRRRWSSSLKHREGRREFRVDRAPSTPIARPFSAYHSLHILVGD